MSDELAACLAGYFAGGKGPSHDQLDGLFQREGLTAFDPAPVDPRAVGKTKRVRAGLGRAFEEEPRGALGFSQRLVGLLRAAGSFTPGTDHYAGTDTIRASQAAFRSLGWTLESGGSLYRTSLEALEGRDLTAALQTYVRRIQQASDDAALTVGTAKDLLEAAARHVSLAATGSYDKRADFPTTVFRVCTQQGIGVPTGAMMKEVDSDPYRALEQALVLAALQVSRLRNTEGTGHGRPTEANLKRQQGLIAAQTAAVVCLAIVPELGLKAPR